MNTLWRWVIGVGGVLACLGGGVAVGYVLPHPLWPEEPKQAVAAKTDTTIDVPITLPPDTTDGLSGTSPAGQSQSAFSPVTLTGRGQQGTKVITLPGGGYRITMTHDGTSNFIVILKDGQGKQIEVLTNQVGKSTTSQVINLPNGSYLFNIGADGNWTIKIEEP